MTSEGTKINYYRNEILRLVDIPYGNGQFSMTVLIPTWNYSLEDIISSLNESQYNEWIALSDTVTSKLTMPKFKIEYKTLLNDALTDMGMGIAFTDGADFSRLFEDPLDLFISRVIHQAVIEVNEEGSEAAAATAVEIMETSLPPEPENILINKPFVFLIREKHSGVILFAGKLMNPT
jgi:serpin B